MRLNRKWLNEDFVDLHKVSDKDFVETLTIFGQKVETWERMDAEIKNVVVGKVLSMVRHPNSDHMWICQVDVGEETPVQIVTGAQNVHEGDLVPAALHNSWLPGGVHITKGKLRGEVSNGMLCSFGELGLTQNDLPGAYADGIWILNGEDCKVGQDINTVIGNDDTVVEFEITNNRPDCYSIIGLAREAAAAFGKPMRHHEPQVHGSHAGSIFEHLDVEVPAVDKCRRYSSRMVANVKIGPSPKWLRQRLRANGVRPKAEKKGLDSKDWFASVRKMLTEYSVSTAQTQFDNWVALEELLLVKFIDGNVKTQNADGSFKHSRWHEGTPEGRTQPGYTEKWKEAVVKDHGDVIRER